MARAVTTQHKTIATVAAWIVALLIFFPILYTIITSFKSEQEAIQGFALIPSGTFESYAEVQAQSGYFKFFMNSVILSVGSTVLALLVAVPAAWSMASPISASAPASSRRSSFSRAISSISRATSTPSSSKSR